MGTYKMIFFSVLMGISMLLQACYPSTKHRKIIQNDSDYDVIVLLPNGKSTGYKSDSLVISSHSEVTIFERSGRDKLYEYQDCELHLDTIRTRIVGNDTLNVMVSLVVGSNWHYFVLKETRRKGGECDCRIQIRNEHIQ